MSRSALLGVTIASMCLTCVRPCAAQEANRTPEKDPVQAKTYAVYFSGLGHIYSGETIRGGALLGTSLVGIYQVAGQLGCSGAANAPLGITADCDDSRLLLWAGLAVGAYVYSLLDAGESAHRANRRRRTPSTTGPLLTVNAGGRVQLGVQLALRAR